MDIADHAARMCPVCSGDSKVYRGMDRRDGVFVRRRVCLRCGTEFETLEVFSGYIRKNFPKKQKSAVSDGQDEKTVVI